MSETVPIYKGEHKCGFCGRTYSDVESRMHCEQVCREKQLAENRAKKEAERKEEQKQRYANKERVLKEIQSDREKLVAKIRKFYLDYKEPVKLDGKYYSMLDDTLFSSFMFDPFREWLDGRF